MYTHDDRAMARKTTVRVHRILSILEKDEPKTNNLNLEKWELRAIMASLTDSMNTQSGAKGMFQPYGKIRRKIHKHLKQ